MHEEKERCVSKTVMKKWKRRGEERSIKGRGEGEREDEENGQETRGW